MFNRLHLKGLQPVNDFQGHSRSLPLLPFDRPYTNWSSIVSISLSCTVIEILSLISQKIMTSRDLDHAHLGTVCYHKTNTSRANPYINLTILSSAFPENFKEYKILKWMDYVTFT